MLLPHKTTEHALKRLSALKIEKSDIHSVIGTLAIESDLYASEDYQQVDDKIYRFINGNANGSQYRDRNLSLFEKRRNIKNGDTVKLRR